MSDRNEELTLGQLGKIVKKSWKRAVVYVLVSLLVAGTILFAVKTITSKDSYSTAITYSAANATTLDRLKQYKSAAVTNALKSTAKSADVDDVLNNLTVTAVTPDNLEEGEAFVPTTFTVSLKKSGDLKLTDNEYKNLLDNIASEYKKAFAASLFPSVSFGGYDENSSTEYFALADELNESVKGVYDLLNNYLNENETLLSYSSADGTTSMQTILNELLSVKMKTSNCLNEIVISGAEKSEGALKKLLDLAATEATAEVTSYTARYNEANANLSAFMNTIKEIETSTDGVTVIKYDNSDFLRLYKEFSMLSEQKNTAVERETVIKGYIANLSEDSASAEKKAEINKTLSELFAKSASVIESYRSLAKEYNEGPYLANEVVVKYPARATTDSLIGTKIMVVLLVAVAIIAYIVAFSKTYGICKKNGFDEPETRDDEAQTVKF